MYEWFQGDRINSSHPTNHWLSRQEFLDKADALEYYPPRNLASDFKKALNLGGGIRETWLYNDIREVTRKTCKKHTNVLDIQRNTYEEYQLFIEVAEATKLDIYFAKWLVYNTRAKGVYAARNARGPLFEAREPGKGGGGGGGATTGSGDNEESSGGSGEKVEREGREGADVSGGSRSVRRREEKALAAAADEGREEDDDEGAEQQQRQHQQQPRRTSKFWETVLS